jgi:hypothetical protein
MPVFDSFDFFDDAKVDENVDMNTPIVTNQTAMTFLNEKLYLQMNIRLLKEKMPH